MIKPVKKGHSCCLLALSLATANACLAESARSSDKYIPRDIEQVTVWATQIRASSVNLEDEAIAIKQADHISDLLRSLPGVDVGGAHSLNQRITIRSMDDKDLRISIDGANQNTYMYHHMGNLQIHADILESVDIEVGTNSVINGGLGGSVRFKTKTARQLLDQDEQWGARIQTSFADNASTGYSLTGFGQLSESIDMLAYYNYIDRDNFDVGGNKIKDADGNEVPNTNGEVKGLEGELEDALLKFGWDLNDNQRIQLSYETYSDKGDYSYRPDMGLATDIAISENLGLPLTYDTEFTRDTLTLSYSLHWGESSSLNASLYKNKSELWRDEQAIAMLWPGEPATVEGEATNTGFNVLAQSVFEAGFIHNVTYGLDTIKYDTDYIADGTSLSGEKATNTAIFVEDRIDFTNGLTLIPGIRYNHYNLDSTVADSTFKAVTTALAAEYEITRQLLVKLGTTQLFKGPEIGEVFVGAGLYDQANTDIEEESGYNTELAIAYKDAVLGADSFAAGITFFRTDIDDYIYDYASPAPAGRSWKDNIGDMQIEGFEAYLAYDLGNLRSLLTISQAESELSAFTQYASLDGARLDRQQGDTLSLSLDYSIPGWNLALHWDMLAVDDVDADLDLDGASKDNAKDSYTVHNISARWTPEQLSGFVLTAGVDNLFDKFYASQSSRTGLSAHPRFGDLYLVDYEPGRNIKLTASYQF